MVAAQDKGLDELYQAINERHQQDMEEFKFYRGNLCEVLTSVKVAARLTPSSVSDLSSSERLGPG